MTVEAGNKIIAEFMGFDYNRSLPGHGGSTIITLGINDCRYHSSWDWLMPVVEKIESLFRESIIFNINGAKSSIEVDTQLSLAYEDIPDVPECYSGYCDTKIKAVYETVIQFIQWYNSQTPQQ